MRHANDSAQSEPFVLPEPRSIFSRAMLYPKLYVWYVLFASLDIMITWIVLHFGGAEVNPMAAVIIERYNLPGMVVYKFTLVLLVILICEAVGRARDRVGRRLAEWAVAITLIPVVVSLAQLVDRLYIHGAHWAWDIP